MNENQDTLRDELEDTELLEEETDIESEDEDMPEDAEDENDSEENGVEEDIAEEEAEVKEPKKREPAAPPATPEQLQMVKPVIEALIFMSSSPVTADQLALTINRRLEDAEENEVGGLKKINVWDIRAVVNELIEEYSNSERLIEILEIAGGYQFFSKPDLLRWTKRASEAEKETILTPATLETLAIIAYRQPLSRAQVEAIRGVACGQIIRNLIDKKLVKITGRTDDLGRSLLYGTTKEFMEIFGLKSIKDLPNIDET